MELRLDGKVALVTGASSGLGERFATTLAASGAAVGLAARRIDRLQSLAATIGRSGGKALPVVMDVTSVADIARAVDEVESQLGPIDILVNNSGVSASQRLGDYTEAEYDHVMNTNVKGAFFVAQTVGKRMVTRGGGRIINIGSAAGVHVMPRIAIYGMSKAAIVHMTKSMAREWGRAGVNVNALCPGYIETELNRDHWRTEAGRKLMALLPRQRTGQTSDLDGLVVLLASDASGFVNGAVIVADDGLSLG